MKTFNPTFIFVAGLAVSSPVMAAQNLYQTLPADVTPQLSEHGKMPVGVTTLTVTDEQHPELFSDSRSERSLKLEVWYPADKQTAPATYENVTRSHTAFTIEGQASRDADLADGQYPLVVVSHGYTGYRHLMFYLGEHLASHGYIVAAIDHTDSTNEEINFTESPYAGFPSTLFNRTRDQQFTLDAMLREPLFEPHIDEQRAGLIGYSMGGYGAVSTVGGCYQFSDSAAGQFTGVKDPAQAKALASKLNTCAGGNASSEEVDPRWSATVALAPWGGQHQLFDPASLARIQTPVLYVAGDADDISGYDGIQWLFDNTGSQGSQMLTIHNARHNIAPHPAPEEAYSKEFDLGSYYEPAWRIQSLNMVIEHFSLAMMDCYLKQDKNACSYLEVQGNSNEEQGAAPWKGFDKRWGLGLSMQHKQ